MVANRLDSRTHRQDVGIVDEALPRAGKDREEREHKGAHGAKQRNNGREPHQDPL